MNPPRTRLKGRLRPLAKEEGLEAKILRLDKNAPESLAIKSGEIDAIIDPRNGQVILLPDAQAALVEGKARFRSLVELSTDGYWEQDESYRFTSHTGAAIGNSQADGAGILGKTLWELSFDHGEHVDWPTHRTQLAWRAIFRDFELRCLDQNGGLRIISISGEPIFDSDGSFRGYRGITRDITERGLLQGATPTVERFARKVLDTLAAQVCVLDGAGTIVKTNAAWRALAATHRGGSADVSEGSNYLSVCDRIAGIEQVDAAAMAAGIRLVIAGERELFRYEYFCDAPEPRWFMATVMRIRDDETARAIVSYEDITEIKQAERLLRLECAVARCLADADTSSVALRAIMQAVCETMDWDCGQYFRLDPASELLHLEDSWAKSSAAVAQFLKRSKDATFRSGAGVSGRVCVSGEPLWIQSNRKRINGKQGDLDQARVPTLAHEAAPYLGADAGANSEANSGGEINLNGMFAFPVVAESKVIGVLAFVGEIVREPDDRVLRTVRSIGNQFGRFLLRQRSLDSLRQSELRLRRLTALSSDWTWEQDSEFRFTKFVGTAMSGCDSVLGKALWELPSVVLDDKDEWTRHKSELQARWSFCDFEYATLLADGQRHSYRISGEPLYDTGGTFLGFHGTGLDITRNNSNG